MPGIYVRADIKEIDVIQKKLASADPIYAKPWRDALTDLTYTTVARLRAAAPHNTGKLDSRFMNKMDSRPVPEWSYIQNTAERNGVAYPFLLNASERYHYAGGYGYGFIGPRPTTKGWWTKTWAGMRKTITDTLAKAAAEIEAKWQQ